MANSKALEGKFVRRTFPKEDVDLQTLEGSREACRDWVMGEYHPCGTCSMGDVVDSHLRVKDVRGLRVVDASIFPNHVSGNICSSVSIPHFLSFLSKRNCSDFIIGLCRRRKSSR